MRLCERLTSQCQGRDKSYRLSDKRSDCKTDTVIILSDTAGGSRGRGEVRFCISQLDMLYYCITDQILQHQMLLQATLYITYVGENFRVS